MAQPPTTAQCETDFGIACYQAFQLQKAYNLAPLFAKGIEGRARRSSSSMPSAPRPSPPT